jgi:hypothetical protein
MAAEEAEMAIAEAPKAAMPSEPVVAYDGSVRSVDEVVQMVGSKTFVLRDGMWIDTSFDADNQVPEQVGFASDGYFELLSAAPILGRYLALGPSVLVVHNNIAYQIVEGEGATEITLPSVSQPEDGPDSGPVQVGPATAPDDGSVDTEPAGPEAAAEGERGLCASAFVAPLAMIGLVLATGKRRWGGSIRQ